MLYVQMNQRKGTNVLRASELFAIAMGTHNQGEDECHWCGSPCRRLWEHGDVQPLPFQRSPSTARRPGNGYECEGCHIYRYRSVTVNFLNGRQRQLGRLPVARLLDRQMACWHSWWITEEGAWALQAMDHGKLYRLLLRPPLRFILALKTALFRSNDIHMASANDHESIRADTTLSFTLDHILHTYTVYELEQALRHGPTGKEPGVQVLLRHLGTAPADLLAEDRVSTNRGRPRNTEEHNTPRRLVRTSGKEPAS
jgi:hypothetical protein